MVRVMRKASPTGKSLIGILIASLSLHRVQTHYQGKALMSSLMALKLNHSAVTIKLSGLPQQIV